MTATRFNKNTGSGGASSWKFCHEDDGVDIVTESGKAVLLFIRGRSCVELVLFTFNVATSSS